MEESLQLVILSFTFEIKTSDTCHVAASCFWISFVLIVMHQIPVIRYDRLTQLIFCNLFYLIVTSIVNFLLCLENMKEMCQK